MKNRLISRVCSVLLTAAMLVTSAPASVFAESIGEESVFTDVEAENDFAEPEVEDAQDPGKRSCGGCGRGAGSRGRSAL